LDQVNFWNKLRGAVAPSPATVAVPEAIAPVFNDEGVLYPAVDEADLASARGQRRVALAYLKQLDEEGFITPLVEDWLLPWEQVYEILGTPEHQASVALLALPAVTAIVPVLASTGSLADADFKVTIQGWESPDGPRHPAAPGCRLHAKCAKVPVAGGRVAAGEVGAGSASRAKERARREG
jgi:hypothetical protein